MKKREKSRELFYVTSNEGKFKEAAGFAEKQNFSSELRQLLLPLDEKQTLDLRSIAIDKALQAWRHIGKPLLVDDSGMYFEKYYHFPGAFSKFVFESLGIEGLSKLIDEGDKAMFLVYLVYIDGPNSHHVFEGRCDGTLIKPKKSTAHPKLPYDDMFIPIGFDQTYAQLRGWSGFDKEGISSRLRAFKKFFEWYHHHQQRLVSTKRGNA